MNPRKVLALIAAVLLAATTPASLAFEHGGGTGRPMRAAGGGMLPLRVLVSVMTPDQRARLDEIMANDRPAMKGILDELHAAHDALATRVLAPGPLTAADLAPQVKAVAAMRDRLLQQALGTTLAVRALLTPEQLTEAATRLQRMRELQDEMHGLLAPTP
jgi:Spy/CpxP family protein refolding chaperone